MKGALLTIFSVLVLLAGCKNSGTSQSPRIKGINSLISNEMSEAPELSKLDRDVKTFMQRWWIRGMSLSIMRGDSLVYAKGYGKADEDREMAPSDVLRIASVSKLITAAGILKLQEEGKLRLSDKVFGEGGILSDSIYTSAIKEKAYFDITIEQLLRHESGLSIRRGDPMFTTRDIMHIYRLKEAPDSKTLVPIVLQRRLGFRPGTGSSYSNFGYLLLSLIIEKVGEEPYEDWMQKNILRPAGCRDFSIAHNYYRERRPNESRYYMQDNDPLVPEYNNSGDSVVRCYGGSDIRALSGAGAWVCSTPELARFVASIDGRSEVPDILSKKSVQAMTAVREGHKYALGWNEVRDGWLRTGSFAGTNSIVYYFPDGECWILVSNTHNWKGPRFSRTVKNFIIQCRKRYSAVLPERNLFGIAD